MTIILFCGIVYMYFFQKESLIKYWKDKQQEIEEKTKIYSSSASSK
jgi:hypothetical protein